MMLSDKIKKMADDLKDLKHEYFNMDSFEQYKALKNEITNPDEMLAAIKDYDNATYKGHEFFNKVYMDKIIPFAKKKLEVGTSWQDEMGNTRNISGQESYLGYFPRDDVFVSGWDLAKDSQGDSPTNVVFIKVDDSLNLTMAPWNPYGSSTIDFSGRMDPKTLKALHSKFPDLVDIRLD